MVGIAYVATPEVLAHYGIDPATIDPATDLLTVHTGAVELADFSSRPDPNAPSTKVQHVDLPRYDDTPNSLITEAAMTRHGWVPMRAAWLVESPDALTSGQVSAARAAAADAGLTIDVRSDQDGLAALRTGATTAGVVLAIAIVMMAIGLLRGESAPDLRTLTATGAAGRTRRALTAATAGTLALLGVVLGMAGAYIALLASFRADAREARARACRSPVDPRRRAPARRDCCRLADGRSRTARGSRGKPSSDAYVVTLPAHARHEGSLPGGWQPRGRVLSDQPRPGMSTSNPCRMR